MKSNLHLPLRFCFVGFFPPSELKYIYYNLIIRKLAHIKVVLWNDFTIVRLHWMWWAKNLSHSEYNIHGICHLYIITRRIISVQIFSGKSCCYQSNREKLPYTLNTGRSHIKVPPLPSKEIIKYLTKISHLDAISAGGKISTGLEPGSDVVSTIKNCTVGFVAPA